MKQGSSSSSVVLSELLRGGVALGEAQSSKALAVCPIISLEDSHLDYLTYDEAAAEGLIAITEISPEGNISELKVVNSATKPVLLMDGEHLVGAKQNRVLNTTVLVAASSKLIIPVSCVERGRWSYSSETLAPSQEPLFAGLRARKVADVTMSLAASKGFTANQHDIWEGIEGRSRELEVESPTLAMADTYACMEPTLSGYESAFELVEGQIGALVGLGGRPFVLELVDSPSVFAKLWGKLLRGYAFDAELELNDKKLAEGDALRFLDSVASTGTRAYKSIGLGEDVRLNGGALVGSALVHEGVVVHLAAFALGRR